MKTSIDQSTARPGGSGVERAKAELLAGIIASTNIYNYGLLVSTNYYNWNGFDPAQQNPTNFARNVNFDYQVGGTALTANQFPRQPDQPPLQPARAGTSTIRWARPTNFVITST